MPSAQEVEKMATSNISEEPVNPKGRPVDLDEDQEWAAGAGISKNNTGVPRNNTGLTNQQIAENVALQEALRPWETQNVAHKNSILELI